MVVEVSCGCQLTHRPSFTTSRKYSVGNGAANVGLVEGSAEVDGIEDEFGQVLGELLKEMRQVNKNLSNVAERLEGMHEEIFLIRVRVREEDVEREEEEGGWRRRSRN